jgi:hypothetical protein
MKPHNVAATVLALFLMGNVGCGTSFTTPSGPANPGSFSTNEPVSGPLIGYVWDPSAAGVRPILGVSAAASMGAALYADSGYSAAVISQLRRYALLTNKEGQTVLVNLPNGEPQRLVNQVSTRQQAAISPSGNSALIYATDLSTLTLIQGLPRTLSMQTINLPASAAAERAAIGDTGLILIASTQADGTSVVRSITPGGTTAAVATVGQLGGLAFLPHSTSALIADAAQNAVLLASGLGGALGISQVAGIGDGIAQPMAVAASADGRWAVVANRQGSTIVRFDLTSRAPTSQVQCSCSPNVLLSLAGNSVFLLTPPGAGSLSLFDGDAAKPRILFIPGIQTASAQGMMR